VEGIAAQAVTDSLGRFRIGLRARRPTSHRSLSSTTRFAGGEHRVASVDRDRGAKLSLIFADAFGADDRAADMWSYAANRLAAGIGPSCSSAESWTRRPTDQQLESGSRCGGRTFMQRYQALCIGRSRSGIRRPGQLVNFVLPSAGPIRGARGRGPPDRRQQWGQPPVRDARSAHRFRCVARAELGAASRGVQGAASDSNPTSGSGRGADGASHAHG